MTTATTSFGMPIADYQVATANQTTLLAQFQKTPQYVQDVAAYQAGVAKITTVDQFLGDYKTLKFALSAYNMEGIIDQKGVLRQLLTQDPDSSDSLAQKLGKQNYIAFAKAFWSLSADGGVGISSQSSINSTVSRYGTAQYRQWLATRNNDAELATALNARATLQDAVDITDVGALYAKFQKAPSVQSTVNYYKTTISSINSVADLLNNKQVLNVALTAYDIDPSTISTDTVQKLLTEDPTKSTSAAAQNPDYLAFANAFASLNTDGGIAISITSTVNDLLDRYQQRAFATAITTNTDQQNQTIFGADGLKTIQRVLGNASDEAGLGLATSYYASHIGAANTANAFAADKQLTATALSAFGLSNVSSDTLQKLLTQNPNAADSLAQTAPEYAAFAKAFSYNAALGPRASDDAKNVTAVQTAYVSNQLQTKMLSDIVDAAAQADRNKKVDEDPSAPLDMYQILGDSDLSTVLLGAYNMPSSVGALDPDQQVEILTNAGFDPTSVNSADAIDKLVQRYMASASVQNVSTQNAFLLALFGDSSGSDGGIVSLDLSSLLAPSTGGATASGGDAYLVNLFA